MQRFDTEVHQHRNTLPAQWRPNKDEPRRAISLPDAFDIAAEKLAEIIVMHGADAVGFYLCKTLPDGARKVFDQLARSLVRTRNVVTSRGPQSHHFFDAALSGEIKVLWIAGSTRKDSLSHQTKILEALAAAPLVIVQDVYVVSDTTASADLLLPTKRPKEAKALAVAHEWLACEIARRLAQRIAPDQTGDFLPARQGVN